MSKLTSDRIAPDLIELCVHLEIARMTATGGPADRDWRALAEFRRRQRHEPGFAEAVTVRIPGRTAEAFSLLVQSLAVLAFWPGGVRLFDRRYVGEPTITATPEWWSNQDDAITPSSGDSTNA